MKKFEFKDGKSIRTEEDEVVNDASAIWARNKKDIKPKEYEEFYKNLTYDQEPPLSYFITELKVIKSISLYYLFQVKHLLIFTIEIKRKA